MAYWRWLFVDEISLMPASMLAMMDQRLREIKADADEWKLDHQGRAQPFGGVNILASGDFEQLPPVGGGYLADVPDHLLREPGEQAPFRTSQRSLRRTRQGADVARLPRGHRAHGKGALQR